MRTYLILLKSKHLYFILLIMQYSETGGTEKALLVYVGKETSDFTHKCH